MTNAYSRGIGVACSCVDFSVDGGYGGGDGGDDGGGACGFGFGL